MTNPTCSPQAPDRSDGIVQVAHRTCSRRENAGFMSEMAVENSQFLWSPPRVHPGVRDPGKQGIAWMGVRFPKVDTRFVLLTISSLSQALPLGGLLRTS